MKNRENSCQLPRLGMHVVFWPLGLLLLKFDETITIGLILQAYVVLGQFLVLKKDDEMFKDWLKETCGANAKQQGDCHQCLKEWCDNFL